MVYTAHGHHIPGTTLNIGNPEKRARCGGVDLCPKCQEDAQAFAWRPEPEVVVDYQQKAKDILIAYVCEEFNLKSDEFTVYVVWWSKTLGNWKAMISTDLPDGLYYELTYDGVKKQTYLDAYEKRKNLVIPD